MPTIEDTITENVANPRKVGSDGTIVEQHPLTEQIEVDRYLGSKNATKKNLGIKMTRIVSPGAV